MTNSPTFDHVDNYTSDLLDLVADTNTPSADHEWQQFLAALRQARDSDDVIYPNELRPLLRGVVAPRRIGAFTHRALSLGLISYRGDWQVSDDTVGRNAGKPARVITYLGANHVTAVAS